MKTLLMYLWTLPAFAAGGNVEMIKTPFWQAPYELSYNGSYTSASEELRDECKELDSVIWNSSGEVQVTRAGLMETIRTLPLKSEFAHGFKVSMPLSVSEGQNLKSIDLSITALAVGKNDRLPDYTHDPDEVILRPVSGKSEVAFENLQAKSLINVSRSLGLKDSPMRISNAGKSLSLTVSGKDAACDLIAGRVQIKARVPVTVKITMAAQMNLINIYNQVADVANKVREKKAPAVRAALLGFHVGQLLSAQQDVPPAKAEDQMVAVLSTFFNLETMETNSLWGMGPTQDKVLSVYGASPEQMVDIHFSFKN